MDILNLPFLTSWFVFRHPNSDVFSEFELMLPFVFAFLFLFIALLNNSFCRFVLHIESWYFKQRCQGSHQLYWQIKIHIVIAEILFSPVYMEALYSNFLNFDYSIGEVCVINYSSPHSLSIFLSVCLCLSLLTSHAWISFHLSKHAVIHNTLSLGRDK